MRNYDAGLKGRQGGRDRKGRGSGRKGSKKLARQEVGALCERGHVK